MCLQLDISEESKKAQIKSSTIEQDLCDHARAERNVLKILMLGVYMLHRLAALKYFG